MTNQRNSASSKSLVLATSSITSLKSIETSNFSLITLSVALLLAGTVPAVSQTNLIDVDFGSGRNSNRCRGFGHGGGCLERPHSALPAQSRIQLAATLSGVGLSLSCLGEFMTTLLEPPWTPPPPRFDAKIMLMAMGTTVTVSLTGLTFL
jgi:hypothetical protein